MKKLISVLITVAMIFTVMSGCGKQETASQVSEVEITLPESTGTRAVVEGEAVITTQLYLLARAYFEKLETYDMDSFDAQEYSELLSNAIEAFRIADAFSESLESHASALAQMEEEGLIEQEKATYEQVAMSKYDTYCSPFVTVAYAAEEKSAAVKYAEELTKTFDNAKNGQKLKAIAEKYGTDAKKAKAMLEQAQAILEGAAYEDQAEFENTCYKVAMDTKAVCSTAVFVISTAPVFATGGFAVAGGASLAGVVDAGGIAFNGVSALIDVGTAWTIHSSDGDGNEYTAAWDKTAEIVAPVSTAFAIGGGIQNYIDFKNPDLIKKRIDNAAQAYIAGFGIARDFVQDGTVLGVSSNVIDGYRKVFAYSAEADTEAAKEALIKSGISEEALEASDEKASNQSQDNIISGADLYIESMTEVIDLSDPIDVEAIIGNIDAEFATRAAEEGIEIAFIETEEAGADDSAVIEEVQPADESEELVSQPVVTGDGLAITDVAGTYLFENEYNSWEQTFELVDDTHLKTYEDDPDTVNVGTYDAGTGVLSYSDDQSEIGFSVTVTFTDTGAGIMADMMVILSDGEGGSMEVPATGMKE